MKKNTRSTKLIIFHSIAATRYSLIEESNCIVVGNIFEVRKRKLNLPKREGPTHTTVSTFERIDSIKSSIFSSCNAEIEICPSKTCLYSSLNNSDEVLNTNIFFLIVPCFVKHFCAGHSGNMSSREMEENTLNQEAEQVTTINESNKSLNVGDGIAAVPSDNLMKDTAVDCVQLKEDEANLRGAGDISNLKEDGAVDVEMKELEEGESPAVVEHQQLGMEQSAKEQVAEDETFTQIPGDKLQNDELETEHKEPQEEDYAKVENKGVEQTHQSVDDPQNEVQDVQIEDATNPNTVENNESLKHVEKQEENGGERVKDTSTEPVGSGDMAVETADDNAVVLEAQPSPPIMKEGNKVANMEEEAKQPVFQGAVPTIPPKSNVQGKPQTVPSAADQTTLIPLGVPTKQRSRSNSGTVNKRPNVNVGNGAPPPKRQNNGSTKKSPKGLTQDDALSYLREVKERFRDRKHVYDKFLEVMKDFKAHKLDTNGVIAHVKDLFRGHRELIMGFNTFLPKGYEIEMQQTVEFDQAIDYVNRIKKRFEHNEDVYKSFLEILNTYRKGEKNITQVYNEVATLFQHDVDLLKEFRVFLPDGTKNIKGENKIKQKKDKNTGTKAGSGQDVKVPKQRKQSAKATKESTENVKTKKSSENDVLFDEKKLKNSAALQKEFLFFEKMKTRLRSKEAFQEFLKCLNIFNQDIISKMELQSLIFDLLGGFPGAMDGFMQVIGRCETMDLDVDGLQRDNKVSASTAAKLKLQEKREKYLMKPISEMDFSDCEKCGASYRMLPADFPIQRCSGRTTLCKQVCNDRWVGVPQGAEDYHFSVKSGHKNQYEENLFRCEDDRFELDMIIETTSSAIEALNKIECDMDNLTEDARPTHRLEEDDLNSVQRRAIRRIYGDQGNELLTLLMSFPAVSISQVRDRLHEKRVEWIRVKKMMRPMWSDVMDKNYQKSLDHRSFYFKQQDKRSVNAKTLIAEIKDIADAQNNNQQVLKHQQQSALIIQPSQNKDSQPSLNACKTLSTLSRRLHVQPDLSYLYPDKQLFDDVYDIVLFAAQTQFSTRDHSQKFIQFWTTFIETFFGLSSRPKTYVPRRIAKRKGKKKTEQKDEDELLMKKAKQGTPLDEEDEDENEKKKDDDDDNVANEVMRDTGEDEDVLREEDDSRHRIDADTVQANVKEEDTTKIDEKNEGQDDPIVQDEDGNSDKDDEEDDDDNEETEENEMASEGEEDEKDNKFVRCVPITETVAQSNSGGTGAHVAYNIDSEDFVFFGNDNLYVLFRLHQLLYDRLYTAKNSGKDKKWKPFSTQNDEDDIEEEQETVNDTTADDGQETKGAVKKTNSVKKMKPYDKFLDLLFDFLGQNVDSVTYEDTCRSLLGTNSYLLFTLDKVIQRLIKHTHNMIQSDDCANKLRQLYAYERKRVASTSNLSSNEKSVIARMQGEVYYANALIVMPEESCYRISVKDLSGDSDVYKRQLDLQLIESTNLNKEDFISGVMDYGFEQYLNFYLAEDNWKSWKNKSNKELRENGLMFLLPTNVYRDKSVFDPEDHDVFLTSLVKRNSRNCDIMNNIFVNNGLQIKINCNTSKMSYVLETEDIFYRSKCSKTTSKASTTVSVARKEIHTSRVKRFHEWLEKTRSELKNEVGTDERTGEESQGKS